MVSLLGLITVFTHLHLQVCFIMNILTISTISLQLNMMNRVGIVHLYHEQLLQSLEKNPDLYMTFS